MSSFQLLKITAFPDAKEDKILPQKDKLWVFTQAPATDGRANTAIKALLAAHLNVPLKNVILVRGSTSPTKTFKIYTS